MMSNKQRGRRKGYMLSAALLATTVLGGGGILLSSALADSTPAPLSAPVMGAQAGFADLVTKVKPAVVNIASDGKKLGGGEQDQQQQMPQIPGMPGQNDQQDSQPKQHALGSGFIIDPAGYVVTNNHVIDGADKITVNLDDGSSYTAKLVGRDAKTDLALLKIEAGKPLPYVTFGDSGKARVGDWVIAVGNPFGLGGTVTAGIVSGHDRNIDSGPYDDFLQIDAPINPGNSGGPLFNQSGQVIGIDSAIYSPNGGSVGIGFAIPSNLASDVVAQLRDKGTVARGWLGIQMQPMTEQLAKAMGHGGKDEGVLVNEVQPDSPALAAKVMQGDIITAYNGTAIKTPRDLAMAVAKTPAGTKAKLKVWRNGQEQTLDVAIGTQAPEKVAAAASDDQNYAPVGMALAPLTPDARSQFGLGPNVDGVVVAKVTPNSHAAESGVQAGDVIVRVGSDAVKTPAEAAAKIHAAQKAKKDAVPLLVSRDGTTYYLALQLVNS
ncbi:MAG TPA: Do family serine endopeptidase [Dongiaceae bacterium]|nr:Do family serine endopeptidase [Dongiaceae bacterium]